MSHNVTLIGSVWLLATIITWLECRWRGYTVAAWAAPLTISAFCLGLFIGAENTSKGQFRVPFTNQPHAQATSDGAVAMTTLSYFFSQDCGGAVTRWFRSWSRN
jgi:hypothetical protein